MVACLTQFIKLDQPDLVSGDYRICYETVRAFRRGEPLKLRPKEFLLFEILLRNRGQNLKREFLADYLKDNDIHYERTLDVHIMRLRKNLCVRRMRNPITTVRDYGYRLD
jgi:DNA-binding response OmpR family regulator